MDMLFGFSGRAGRGQWWLGQLAILGIVIALMAIIWATAPAAENPADGPGLSSIIVLLIACVLMAWINLAVTIKRYHDRDKSGWWFCIAFIPMIGPIWQLVECGFLAGTRGGNHYGPGGGNAAFADELEAHIAQMKGEGASTMTPAAAAPVAPRTMAPVQTTRRPVAPGGFGKRGL